jgi:putative zinc finger/helix-turn-helix YgiT family protein
MSEQAPPTYGTCPECGKGQLVGLTRTEEFDFDLGDGTIKVRAENVPVKKCDVCGEVMSGPDAAQVRHEAVCRAAGLLTPAEYRAIREGLGWSQQYLADLTGFGAATVSRAERGRLLPNRSFDKVLRALRDCPPFREYLREEAGAERGNGASFTRQQRGATVSD